MFIAAQQVRRVRDLGLQAAQLIAQAEDPLAALVEVSGNMPAKAAALSRMPVNPELHMELHSLGMFPPGECV